MRADDDMRVAPQIRIQGWAAVRRSIIAQQVADFSHEAAPKPNAADVRHAAIRGHRAADRIPGLPDSGCILSRGEAQDLPDRRRCFGPHLASERANARRCETIVDDSKKPEESHSTGLRMTS